MNAITRPAGREGKISSFFSFSFFSLWIRNFTFLILQQSSRGCEIPIHVLLIATVVLSQAKSSLPCQARQSSALRHLSFPVEALFLSPAFTAGEEVEISLLLFWFM